MKRKLIFLQIILCMLLLLFYVILRTVSTNEAVTAGSFGGAQHQNLTFEDYMHNKYGDLF